MPQPFPFYETRGGFRTASVASGLQSGTGLNAIFGGLYAPIGPTGAADLVVFSGQGRLNSIIPGYTSGGTGISGLGCTVYDAAPGTCGSGGPFITSGQRLLGMVPGNTFNLAGTGPGPVIVDTPFYSGLCIGRLQSGVPAFSITFTPEYNPIFAG